MQAWLAWTYTARAVEATAAPVQAFELDRIELAVHEEGAMKLTGEGLHIGLFQEKFTSPLPMRSDFLMRPQPQQVAARILDGDQDVTALGRERIGQVLRQVGGTECDLAVGMPAPAVSLVVGDRRGTISSHVRVLEMTDIEARLTALEKAQQP
jgi:hypothetical protein